VHGVEVPLRRRHEPLRRRICIIAISPDLKLRVRQPDVRENLRNEGLRVCLVDESRNAESKDRCGPGTSQPPIWNSPQAHQVDAAPG
jgi:hypothetical protein